MGQIEPWLQELLGGVTVPSRKIRPSRYGVTAYKATQKAGVSQEAESSLEYDFLTLLEYDQRVEKYVTQPFKIDWKDKEGRRRVYTPDVIVKYADWAMTRDPALKTTIFEVKYQEDLKEGWQELKPKLRAAIGFAKEIGCRFHLTTEKQIRTPYLTNARFLMGYLCRNMPNLPGVTGSRQRLILRALYKLEKTTPRKLLEEISLDKEFQAELIPYLWNLVNQGMVGMNLMEKLTMNSPIWTLPITRKIVEEGI